MHQQEDLVGAMLLRLTRRNRSSLCQCQGHKDRQIKELGRSTQINIHNTRWLIRTSQVCLGHLAVGRALHGGRIYTHT